MMRIPVLYRESPCHGEGERDPVRQRSQGTDNVSFIYINHQNDLGSHDPVQEGERGSVKSCDTCEHISNTLTDDL